MTLSYSPFFPGLITPIPLGQYFFPDSTGNSSTSAILNNGTLRLAPWLLTKKVTLTDIGAEITSAGDAGSTLRLAVLADNGSCYPGALKLDAGTIAADSATVQAITGLTTVLTPGLYWIGGVVQGVTVTQPTVRTMANFTIPCILPVGTTLPSAGVAVLGYQQTGITGAIPASFTSTLATTGSIPRILMKVAA